MLKSVSKNEKLKLYGYLLKLLLHKKTRTRQVVESEYQNGIYKKILESRYWDECNNLTEFNNIDPMYFHEKGIEEGYYIIDNMWCKTTKTSWNSISQDKFLQIMKKFRNENKIIELGCGMGRNLFLLKGNGFQNKLVGCDISENAINIANMINKKFDLSVEFFKLDLITEKDFNYLTNSTVLTYFVLEQLKYNMKEIIEKIIDARPTQVINFEYVPNTLKKDLRYLGSRIYNYAVDYQTNLYTILKQLEKQNLIEIKELFRTGYSDNPFREISILRWIPL